MHNDHNPVNAEIRRNGPLLKPVMTAKFDQLVRDTRLCLAMTDEPSVEYALLAMTGQLDESTMRCLIAYLALRLAKEGQVIV